MATKEEENQCPTSTSTKTSAFKRLSISTLKKDRPSTSVFDRLKMTNDQQREMKMLKTKIFREENNDDGKIHSHVPSCMKRKLFVDISTEGSLTVKPRLIIYTNSTNEEDEDLSMCCNREDLHLHLLTCVAAEKLVISNMLQLRSKKIFISNRLHQEDDHLKHVTADKNDAGDHHLQCNAMQAIIIFNNAAQTIIIFMDHHIYLQYGHNKNDNHLHLKCGRHLHLQCNTVEMIIIFIFNTAQQRRSSSSSQCDVVQVITIFNATQTIIIFNAAQTIILFNATHTMIIFNAA
ncbi:gag protease polyprotein [Cucumis melo var. makuwa]|uniref:Gag protease polyprotein n=1 Tax=Cucumis melo var. makuwa TaxID=1194695 RepID=A0A5A7UDW0_CUCMM|nr:gag protease polyprotein [Cucumis melo var. makuwa]TYJ99890.1 gag protease polyprotein [Cucumis melo var. makuwa]